MMENMSCLQKNTYFSFNTGSLKDVIYFFSYTNVFHMEFIIYYTLNNNHDNNMFSKF